MKTNLLTVPVQMTPQQQAVFARIAKLQEAEIGDVMLTMAALWISCGRGHGRDYYVSELGESLWKFAAVRMVPTNRLYAPEPARPKV